MKISPVYTISFSFHSGLGFCLHDTVSPCTVMVSPNSGVLPRIPCLAPLIGSLGWLTIRELIDFETSKMV